MLPVRINLLLLLFVSLLFSCNTQKKDDESKSPGTVKTLGDQFPADITVENKIVQVKKEDTKRSASKSKRSIDKNSIVKNRLAAEYKVPQSFIISSERDTTVNGEEGTVIKIKHGSFVYEQTGIDVTGPITFHLAEYYKLSDILAANLSTESNGSILETGGMLFIAAWSEGKKCGLKKNSDLDIQIPFAERKEGMQLFVGVKKENKIDWVPHRSQVLTKEPVVEAAEFPGGSNMWIGILDRYLEYPDTLGEMGTFKLVVRFSVDTFGNTKYQGILNASTKFKVFDEIISKAFSKMPRWKPEKRNGVPVEAFFTQAIYFTPGSEEQQAYDSFYRAKFEARVSDSNINNLQTKEIGQYVFSSSMLGWINCDRFLKSTAPKKDLFVRIKEYNEADVKLIFHGFKGILEGSKTPLGYLFKEVPGGENITILAIARKNARIFISLKECNTNDPINGLVFEPVSIDILKQKVAQLNNQR